MNLSLAHAHVAWDPRISAAEAKLLPHKLSPSLIIQLLLALPFSMEWIHVSIPLGHKWFGEIFILALSLPDLECEGWHPAKWEACIPSPILSKAL
jgi:hypothetical protein